ncbi:hypothetical protein [Desulfonatronovibrio hydrogenovorans]|uniref:hypothetical protein n=1 Tax=Desulfonatronovibrio hydrogenovorans TaxID=53245 RepID=UPI000551FE20|nr:hypothetical protein [Desulfonatronovibrio hydrogenovorans]
MPSTEYSLVVAIVNQGVSEHVVDIAEELGASGGTVFFGRGSSTRTKISILGVPVEPLKELIYIVAKRNLAPKIIKKINQDCRLDEPSGGLAFSMPLDEVAGLGDFS